MSTVSPPQAADPPMTAAHFRVLREDLALTTKWLAEHFGVGHRIVGAWDRAERQYAAVEPDPAVHATTPRRGRPKREYGIPAARAAAMHELEATARQQADELATQLRVQGAAGRPVVRTYRTDAEYQEHDGGPYSAAWHRALVGRAVEAHDGPVTILYVTDQEPTSGQDMPAMTAAEFHVLRDRLGVTIAWLAEYFDVQVFAVQRWERGDRPILEARAAAMRELDRIARAYVEDLARELEAHAARPQIQTYLTDEQYQEHDGGPFSASWHRARVGRVLEVHDGPVTILYATDDVDQ
jgi:DNA-binding transcriptional regulator YiaG